ncbi:MAG TPA: hypothetical protein VLA43_01430 [Longimicrobiales bacterium]|nr:hypothetical protein [Longimicrobiales bacterium]
MIDWDNVAPMVMGIVMFLTIGGVLILRPIAKHLGAYLEALTRQQLDPGRRDDLGQIRDSLDHMSQRLALLEERQDFAERLLENRERKELPLE